MGMKNGNGLHKNGSTSFTNKNNGNIDYKYNNSEDIIIKPNYTEKKIGVILFLITFIILFTKIFGTIKQFLIEQLQWKQLMVTNVFNVKPMLTYKWETGFYGSEFIWPLICGLSVSLFTWLIVYLDSDVIGIHPPQPFSPTKNRCQYKKQTACHMGYLMSIASGVTVFFLLLFTETQQ